MMFNFKEIVDKVLNESLSRVVFHFTNIIRLFGIIAQNKFILSTSNGYDEDYSYGYPYYLSTTRVKDARFGYSRGFNVRLTLDSQALNSRFRAKPVSFFSGTYQGKEGKKISPKQNYINKISQNLKNNPDSFSPTSYNVVMTDVENEDRLLSNKPYIENPYMYILRIDILMNLDEINEYMSYRNGYDSIKNILSEGNYSHKTFVYGTFKDFNRQTNPINDKVEQILSSLTFDMTEKDRQRLKQIAGLT